MGQFSKSIGDVGAFNGTGNIYPANKAEEIIVQATQAFPEFIEIGGMIIGRGEGGDKYLNTFTLPEPIIGVGGGIESLNNFVKGTIIALPAVKDGVHFGIMLISPNMNADKRLFLQASMFVDAKDLLLLDRALASLFSAQAKAELFSGKDINTVTVDELKQIVLQGGQAQETIQLGPLGDLLGNGDIEVADISYIVKPLNFQMLSTHNSLHSKPSYIMQNLEENRFDADGEKGHGRIHSHKKRTEEEKAQYPLLQRLEDLLGENYEAYPSPYDISTLMGSQYVNHDYGKIFNDTPYEDREVLCGVVLIDPVSKRKVASKYFDLILVDSDPNDFMAMVYDAEDALDTDRPDYSAIEKFFRAMAKMTVDSISQVEFIAS